MACCGRFKHGVIAHRDSALQEMVGLWPTSVLRSWAHLRASCLMDE